MNTMSNRTPSQQGGGATHPAGESPMPWALDQSLDSRLGLDATHGDAPAKKRISQGVMVLLLVLVVAAGALFIMRKTGQPSVNNANAGAEKQIELALAQLTGNQVPNGDPLMQNTDQVISRFADDPTARQVDLDHVRKNPFTMTLALPAPTDNTPVVTVSNVDRVKQQQQAMLRAELSKLTLQSVMQGRTPLAVISNKVVRTGDTIGSFRVVAIETRTVTLTADGNSYQLTMDQPMLGGQ